MKISQVCLAAILISAPSLSAAAQETTTVEFAGHSWDVAAKSANLTTWLGREALHLTQGRVWLDSAGFGEGVVEFDVAYTDSRGFVGLNWYQDKTRNRYEEIYLRAHLSGQPDAVQYTPVENKNSAWQIFTGSDATAKMDHLFTGWSHVKLVVKDDKADLYVNSSAPILHIPDLKTDIKSGGLALRANAGQGEKSAYFSNLTFRPLQEADVIVGKAEAKPKQTDGLIRTWQVSSNVTEAAVSGAQLPRSLEANLTWGEVKTETNGIANLSRLASRDRKNNTVLVRTIIRSDIDQIKEMTFGYSDRIRLFVNGEFVYSGISGWKSRDHRFYGTVGPFDSAGLRLKKGDNIITAAVSENFGGWGFMGIIKNQDGIEVAP